MDYARTLNHWREHILLRCQTFGSLGFDERFVRMWNYYLLLRGGRSWSERSARCTWCSRNGEVADQVLVKA